MLIIPRLTRCVKRGAGVKPASEADQVSLQMVTVQHPVRKEYIILDITVAVPDNEVVAYFRQITKMGYTVMAGYLPPSALDGPNAYKRECLKYLDNANMGMNACSDEEFRYFFDTQIAKPSLESLSGAERKRHFQELAKRNEGIILKRLNGTSPAALAREHGLSHTRMSAICYKFACYLRMRNDELYRMANTADKLLKLQRGRQLMLEMVTNDPNLRRRAMQNV